MLGIESSWDETAALVVANRHRVLSIVVFSQAVDHIETHVYAATQAGDLAKLNLDAAPRSLTRAKSASRRADSTQQARAFRGLSFSRACGNAAANRKGRRPLPPEDATYSHGAEGIAQEGRGFGRESSGNRVRQRWTLEWLQGEEDKMQRWG